MVEKGDSLWSIAKKYGLTADELKQINNLTSNLLNVGDVLKVSLEVEEPKENIYTVQKGDSLYSIAKRYGLTVDELKKINNITSNTLSIGQELIVKAPESTSTYTVQKGDTLYSIANKYKITVNKLKEMNNLNINEIYVGQKLNVPTLEKENKIYTVQKGDNLYRIAQMFNTTVTDIQKLNNLSGSTLSVGQKLLIPN